jgi:hypothetical protein
MFTFYHNILMITEYYECLGPSLTQRFHTADHNTGYISVNSFALPLPFRKGIARFSSMRDSVCTFNYTTHCMVMMMMILIYVQGTSVLTSRRI